MHSEKVPRSENSSAEHKIFQRAYNRKFVNEAVSELVEKRRIIASQLRNEQPSAEKSQDKETRSSLKGKSRSVGSLLPQIKQIEAIAKSEKKPKAKSLSNSLSKLQIYLTQKNIKRSQQLNILFLTQSNYVIPDRLINEKFNSFVAITQDNKPKNLRALLSLTGDIEVSEGFKAEKIGKQKQELTQIVKTMIEQHNAQEDNKLSEAEKGIAQQEIQQEESVENDSPQKDINWVLKQCKKYDKKFRLKRKKNGSKQKGNKQ